MLVSVLRAAALGSGANPRFLKFPCNPCMLKLSKWCMGKRRGHKKTELGKSVRCCLASRDEENRERKKSFDCCRVTPALRCNSRPKSGDAVICVTVDECETSAAVGPIQGKRTHACILTAAVYRKAHTPSRNDIHSVTRWRARFRGTAWWAVVDV